ncbi:MAG TPA: Zn-dependent hydrolase [Acidimicrobiales bacterium]|nr:Zn-dependent hydrolase [Acidimicrobiales bacterium]
MDRQPAPRPLVRPERLLADLEALARVGDTGDGGNCRLALTDDDAGGRELVVGWMRDLGLDVRVDRIGNVVATRPGTDPGLDPVMTGSHIDTVRTGGRYDGTLGVLAGLEVVRALDDAGLRTRRPLSVAFFTDEEGSRFAPDMLGSLVYVGGMALEDALGIVGIDGAVLGDELARIDWAGDAAVPGPVPHAFVELHIEQGPLLEEQGVTIGAVTGVQGISWHELTLTGQSNHAGTTPMHLRHDAAYAAAEITTFVRRLAAELGGHQVGTVGRLDLHPDLVNVVAARAAMTVDLRNTDDAVLAEAERRLRAHVAEAADAEGVEAAWRRLARFAPVAFDPGVVDLVERTADKLGHSVMRLPSGAGHDAQMLARTCPTGMVFVPSRGGISHNPAEHTEPEQLAAGAQVLADVLVDLAS